MERISFWLIFIACFTTINDTFSQDLYYWNTEEKIFLEEDRASLSLYFSEDIPLNEIINVEHSYIKKVTITKTEFPDRAIIELYKPYQGSVDELLSEITLARMFLNSGSWGLKLNGSGLWLSNGILYKKNEKFDPFIFEDILSGYPSFVLSETDMGFKKILLDDLSEILPLSNELFETGMFAYVHPDFMIPIRENSDPLYPNQYFFNNTGQFGGTSGVDINATTAWGLVNSSPDITVAILDDGVEEHEDLEDVNGISRVLTGYSPGDPDGVNGLPVDSFVDVHGQCIAGLIAASHNSLGGRGVAPNVKIKSAVPHDKGDTATVVSNYVDAITWAWKTGSDVINNSWTFKVCGKNLLPSFEAAIDSALTFGRNGKGTMVVFSAGYNNGGSTCIQYPATLSQVFTLSAINNQGTLSHYSPFGSEIDAAIPTSDSISNIYTIDRMGKSGLDSGNYTSNFGGTSAAAGITSGIIALMISADSNLTQSQITSILISTANDLGSPGKDDSTGYGRLNAGSAVNQVLGTFPVEWSDFYGETQQNKVNLTWITSRETNSQEFHIERSQGGSFINIGTVAAKGFSDSETEYSFIDLTPRLGTNYYRLKQIDLNGQYQYSSNIEVNVESDDFFQIEARFSDLDKDDLQLTVFDTEPSLLKITVLDFHGREVYQKNYQAKSNRDDMTISLKQLPAGIYFLQVYAEGRGMEVRKFTKK